MVNLYCVSNLYDYCWFVFAETANRAKALCVNYFTDDEPYINMRAKIIKKDVGGETDIVVDSETDKDYGRVLAAGGRFLSEEEI